MDCEKDCKNFPTCRFSEEGERSRHCNYYIQKQNHQTSEAVVTLNNLLAAKGGAKQYIDANVWDGEDRAGCPGDSARFTPDELQELVDEMLEHLSS